MYVYKIDSSLSGWIDEDHSSTTFDSGLFDIRWTIYPINDGKE